MLYFDLLTLQLILQLLMLNARLYSNQIKHLEEVIIFIFYFKISIELSH